MTGLSTAEAATNTLNIRLLLDHPTSSHHQNYNNKINMNGKPRSPLPSPLAHRGETSRETQSRGIPLTASKSKDESTNNEDHFESEESTFGLGNVRDFGVFSSPSPPGERGIRRSRNPGSRITLQEIRDDITDEEERCRQAKILIQSQSQSRSRKQSQSQALDEGPDSTSTKPPQTAGRNSRTDAGGGGRSDNTVGYSHQQIMRMANSPLSASLLATLADKGV